MVWTTKLSNRLAKKITTDENHERFEEIAHGIEIFLLYLLNIAGLFAVSYLLNAVWEVFFFTLVYYLHRLITGGVHMSTPLSCLIVGTALLSGLGYAVSLLPLLSTSLATAWILVATSASLLINLRYAPAAHTYLPTNDRIRIISRRVVAILVLLSCPFLLFLVNYEQKVAILYSTAVLLQAVHLHPVSYRLVAGLEKTMGKGGFT